MQAYRLYEYASGIFAIYYSKKAIKYKPRKSNPLYPQVKMLWRTVYFA